MGSKSRNLLHWVLLIVVIFSPVYGLTGSPSQPSIVQPPKFEASTLNIQTEITSVPPSTIPESSKEHNRLQHEAPATNSPFKLPPPPGPASSPKIHGKKGVPVAAPLKELSSILTPLNHSNNKGVSPVPIPAPSEAKATLDITEGPLVSPSRSSASSFRMSPIPNAHAPLASPLQPSASSPVNPSNITLSPPLPSNLYPSESPPAISPAQNEVNNSSETTNTPSASHSNITDDAPHSNLLPSESSPIISPSAPEVKEPSNNTVSPPPKSFPAISPTLPEVKKPINTTTSLPTHPIPSESSPMISPTPPQTKDPLNTTHSPLPSHPLPSVSSPFTSPSPHQLKEPSNITHSPLPSNPLPSISSPDVSPTPPEVKEPSNTTLSPLPSHQPPSSSSPTISNPLPSISSPGISPTSPEVKEPSNTTHSPPPSHQLPSSSSPTISSSPHEGIIPSNTTHAPSASNPKPSNVTHSPLPSPPIPSEPSPLISPSPHEVKDHSNTTHSPLKDHSNTTHSASPSASDPNPLRISPTMSPTQHEVNNPSNITSSPLASHSKPSLSPLPSKSSPEISPTPDEEEPSNSTRSPLPSPHRPSVSSPLLSPMPHEVKNPSNVTHAPSPSYPHPSSERIQTPALAPTVPQHSAPLAPSLPSSHDAGPIISPATPHIPAASPSYKGSEDSPPPHSQVPSLSPAEAPLPSKNTKVPHAPSPASVVHSPHNKRPTHPPTLPPILPPRSSRKSRAPPPQVVWALPPPPPNLDCKLLSCQEPVTYPPPGSLCACVRPIKVGLRLSIALYTFFPLVSELAQEIAPGIFMKQSQVRVMGANSSSEDPGKTIVLIDLVPLGSTFDFNTALKIYSRFWHKQVIIESSYFGDYDVLYVLYPGLPPSPPTPGDVSIDGGPNGGNAMTMKPLGVNVKKRKQKLSNSLVVIIVLVSVVVVVITIGAAWILILRCKNRSNQPPPTSQQEVSPSAKAAGAGPPNPGSGPSSTSASFTSSIPAHTGSAKTFNLAEVERATDRFNDSRIIGEGGFGRVYQGTLEDGTMVAVKVLKRDDQQGGREFLAEVEMLSRLHHRNLVKLIGFCTEESARCLVYELIPNGSVESHLHGLDKETSPLDWNARMKIALGAARGLAYLHEDSSPRVIHRDFKSSNILLEHDFTPKVSDFGLARTALGEGNDHISTRVMGTFGYVAPEYAMTGHLLVKSDVYSYGVVLLELLTGRKPIDMSQPPGQENLVNWARPLLESDNTDGLEKMIDPSLSSSTSVETIAKVTAIASMCVQPEVSHRPFMGEVVQALRLVCNESGEHRRSFSLDDSSTKDSDIRISAGSGFEDERVFSESNIYFAPSGFGKDTSGSFRRYFSSGPLKMGRSEELWERERGFSSGSMMKRGMMVHRSRLDLERGEQWA
ncbi:mucin-5AC-like isoform X2 [Asparagus officinalis]|uniref:mucin-5AC-like isoform X2 n=1 Tax=Asparagus officinalis TaxID=4686 RepID=UPI00098DFB25|nr:mucin-5AC-like isoform X2 [Asparagus officinalis]